MAQQVVRLQHVRGDQANAVKVSAGQLQIMIVGHIHQKNRLGSFQPIKRLPERLGPRMRNLVVIGSRMVEQLQLKDIAYQAIWLSRRWKQLGSFAIQFARTT